MPLNVYIYRCNYDLTGLVFLIKYIIDYWIKLVTITSAWLCLVCGGLQEMSGEIIKITTVICPTNILQALSMPYMFVLCSTWLIYVLHRSQLYSAFPFCVVHTLQDSKTQKYLFDHYLHFLKLHIINIYINSLFIRSRRLPLRPHVVAGLLSMSQTLIYVEHVSDSSMLSMSQTLIHVEHVSDPHLCWACLWLI